MIKNFKHFISASMIFAICFCTASCGTNPPVSQPSISTEEESTSNPNESNPSAPIPEQKTYPLQSHTENIKQFGRLSLLSNGITCDASASGISFNAYIEGDLKLEISSQKGDSYFTVWIDGTRVEERFCVEKDKTKELTVASFSEGGVHEIKILKQSEPMLSLSVLHSVSFFGYFEKAPKNETQYIEFIGDSLISGYGNLVPNGTPNAGSSLCQDATQTFAFLSSELLGTDFSLVSCSGIGMVKGYREFPMKDFYTKTSYYRDAETTYDFARTPDLVVVRLGSNDQLKGATEAEIKSATAELIALIRSVYGDDTTILWTYLMNANSQKASTWELSAIQELGGTANGIYTFELTPNADGGSSHPSVQAHESNAQALALFIIENNLLG